MSEIKSHEFDNYVQRALSHRVFVVYGPDRGLVSERAALLAKRTGVALDDPFAMIKMDVAELQAYPGRLLDEINSIGLFGGERLVWVKGAANEKPLLDALDRLSKTPPHDSFLIIEAGDLKKGSGLRKAAESSSTHLTIPCYADDTRALNALIDQEIAKENLRISHSARQRLIDALGGDRIASRNEIMKLALYCKGQDVIEDADVVDIIGDASGVSVDDAVDAVLKGDHDGLLLAIKRITLSKTSIFLVLQSCLRQLQLLDLMRDEMDQTRQSPSQVVASLGRHLHFKRKPVIEAALRKWSGRDLNREMQRLQATILQSRTRPLLEDSIAAQTLLSISYQSARK